MTSIFIKFKKTEFICNLIDSSISDTAPIVPGDGRTIKSGFAQNLDTIRENSTTAKEYMASMESLEKTRTGIKSLKIGHNKVFGYYIEVSKSNLNSIPPEYIRKQTLVGGERFITPEMKEHEVEILNAQEQMSDIEITIFNQICSQISSSVKILFEISLGIALTDVFCSLSSVAKEKEYTKPE